MCLVLRKILELLVTIKQQNEDIMKAIRNKNQTQLLTTLIPEDFPVKLPLMANNDILILEEYLQNNDTLSALVS